MDKTILEVLEEALEFVENEQSIGNSTGGLDDDLALVVSRIRSRFPQVASHRLQRGAL